MKPLDVPGLEGYGAFLIDSLSDSDYASYEEAYLRLVGSTGRSLAVRPAHFRLKTQHMDGSMGPYIVMLRKDGVPVAMAVGRAGTESVAMRAGAPILPRPRIPCLTVPEDGFMVEGGSDEYAAALLRALRHCLGSGTVTLLRLLWIPRESSLFGIATAHAPGAFRAAFPVTTEHWFTDLGGSLEEMLAQRSKKHRGNLKRIMRKIDSAPERFLYREFREPCDVQAFLEDAERLVAGTYQRSWEVGFRKDRSTEACVSLAASEGRLLGLILYADGNPCAFQLGIGYGDTHTILYMAHDSAYDAFDPGIYLLLRSLDSLCRTEGVRVVDYGWGDGEHKRRFGNRHRLESNIVYFAPTVRGLRLCMCMSIFRFMSKALRRFKAFGRRDARRN